MAHTLDSVITDDGSSTLYSPHFSSHYHSLNGAKNESKHIFIDYGLVYYYNKLSIKKSIDILEYGFGTGLNAILTYSIGSEYNIPLYYKTLEAYPVHSDIVGELKFDLIPEHEKIFHLMHSCEWNQDQPIAKNFTLHKKHAEFEAFEEVKKYDIIYFDAFCPATQPHLWEEIQMKKCYDLLLKDGILVTFSAKGSFKRALRSLGFEVERLPGPPGKREMTRATKI